jgi:ABC-type Fe3+-siderophore transport system permease subunit
MGTARTTCREDPNEMQRFLIGVAILGIAVGLGFAAGAAVIMFFNAVLPPFRPEDDETLREFIPVALAYATMAATVGFVLLVAWRRLRQRPSTISNDTTTGTE